MSVQEESIREGEAFWDEKKECVLVATKVYEDRIYVERQSDNKDLLIELTPQEFVTCSRFMRMSDPEHR